MSIIEYFNKNYKDFFRAIPENYILLTPDLIIISITDHLLETPDINKENLINRNLLDVISTHSNLNIEEVENSRKPFEFQGKLGNNQFNFSIASKNGINEYLFCKVTAIPSNTSQDTSPENPLKDIANSFPGIIALYNCLTGEYLYVNKSVENILGYSSAEIIKQGAGLVFSLIHPDDANRILEENIAAVTNANEKFPDHDDKKVFYFEYRVRSSDGTYKWLQTYGIIFERNEENLVKLILNVSIDITERKENELKIQRSEKILNKRSSQLEERLKEGEEQLQQKDSYFKFITDTIPGIFWIANSEGDMEYYSKQWEEITGMSTKDAIAGGWKKVFHPEDFESSFKKVEHSIKTGEEYKVEHRIICKDGNSRWYISRALPLKDENGNVSKWFGTSFDIDDEKKILDELKESRSKYKFLADSIPQMIYTTTPEGVIDYLNKRWYEYTGLPQEDLDLKKIRDVVHPEDLEYFENTFAHSINTGYPFNIEFRLKKHTGEYRWFLGKAIPMKNYDGKIIKWFGSSTDIQEQKVIIEHLAKAEKRLSKTNLKLSKKNEELRKINNDLDNFIYTASHDLKAPISNIEGLLNFIKTDEFYKNPEIKEVMTLMEKSTERFKTTIEGLTDVAKIQKTFDQEIEEIEIDELIKDVLSDIPEYRESQIISTDLQVSKFKFSIKNFRSILFNLIGNAIKYKSPYRNPEIKIATKETKDYLVLIVEDNGLGIEKGNQEKVFKMFKRLHTHIEGTGIGLYIVKRIMDNSEGKIEIESVPGLGTKFILYFKKF